MQKHNISNTFQNVHLACFEASTVLSEVLHKCLSKAPDCDAYELYRPSNWSIDARTAELETFT